MKHTLPPLTLATQIPCRIFQRILTLKTLVLSTLIPFTLTGCGTYSEHFDCPVGTGMKCTSLSTINKRIDAHEIDLGEEPESSQSNLIKSTERKIYYTPRLREQLARGA